MELPLIYKTSNIIFNDKTYSDIEFVFENDKKIYSHGTVLLIECPKLFDLGRGNSFGECSVSLKDRNIDAFSEFLKFVYVGFCNNQFVHFNELIALSREFDKTSLIDYLNVCIDDVKVENAVQILEFCMTDTNFEDKKTKVLEFIEKNYSAVLKSESFSSCSKFVIDEILKIDKVSEIFTGELEVFNAVMKYADSKIEKLEDNDKKCGRDILGDTVKLIRFPAMSNKELSTCLIHHRDILTDKEGLDIFLEINGGPANTHGFSKTKRICTPLTFNTIPQPQPFGQPSFSFGSSPFLSANHIATAKFGRPK